MNILENELVRKYFSCQHDDQGRDCKGDMAYRILQAMQEPIRKGERYLERFQSNPDNEWQQCICQHDADWPRDYHPIALRLPDKFQKRECEPTQVDRLHGIGCGCCPCHHDVSCKYYQPLCDAVEEKIKELMSHASERSFPYAIVIEKDLRELVTLAREGK